MEKRSRAAALAFRAKQSGVVVAPPRRRTEETMTVATMAEPTQKTATHTISVIVPVFNEADTIRALLKSLREAPFPKEIIVVDDRSTDGTGEILAGEGDIVLVRHERNRGKGAAIRTGLERATGEIVIIQDADLEYDPNEIPTVVAPILEGATDISYGSRFKRGLPKDMPLPNKVANLILAWTVRILFGHPLTDEATCYKAFRASVLKSIPLACERFEFCPEVTAKALRAGYRIVETELVNYRPRTQKSGKKIRWTDGVEAMITLVRYRFSR
jgi:dolichol-phosphate mannosyltransferase